MNKAMRMTMMTIVLLCGLGMLPASAALQASVDRNPVAEDESFTLTLESDEDINGGYHCAQPALREGLVR